MKYKFLLIAAVALNTAAFSQSQWIRQATPTLAFMSRIVFSDTLNGWSAAGDSGIIIHTTNGGVNWVKQNTGIDYGINDLFFLNSNTGWAIANDFFFFGTTILTTTNGGVNWQSSRFPDTTLVLYTVFFQNINTGYLAGYDGAILKTTNGGVNYTRCEVDSSFFSHFPVRKITFLNQNTGIACGGAYDIQGLVWITSNAGLNWTPVSISGEPIFRVKYKDPLNLIGVGGDFEYGPIIVKSTSAGSVWSFDYLNMPGLGSSIDFRTNTEYWIPLGFGNKWAVSTNAGATFYDIPAPDSAALYDVVFKSPTAGWCCGTNGSVYKYNSATIGIGNYNNSVPSHFYLSQNYPNPFNPVTKIKFGVPHSGNITLKIFDVLGREVKEVVNQFAQPGTYEILFDASDYPSGVYYYKITANSFSDTKKLVVLK